MGEKSLFYFVVLGVLYSTHALGASETLDPIFYESSSEEFAEALYKPENTVANWVRDLNDQNLPFLCLGERHDNKFRSFYAEHFFSEYSLDVLYLEATQEEADELVRRSLNNETEVPFLGADIGEIIRTIYAKNNNAKFIGVEQTDTQKVISRNSGRVISREGFIAQNVFEQFSLEKKQVLLYGANHCALNDIGLGNKTPAYRHLQKVIPTDKMRTVRLLFHKISNRFSANLSRLGLPQTDTVFKDINKIPESTYNHVWDLKKNMTSFDDIIYAY